MGAIVLVVGIIGVGAVIAAVIVFAVTRSRRSSGNGSPAGGTYPQNMGYPPQQPMYPPAQQPYPSTAPNQGYPTPPGQPPQHPNPYPQQPPYQGQ
jgi:hypothetical protein